MGSDPMKDLNEIMEFDHVIASDGMGNITEPKGLYAPELHAYSDADGSHTAETDPELHRQAEDHGWALETGWTGQYLYSGPCMHPSEFVGGAMADYIRETVGYWVVTAIYEDDGEPESWALCYRPLQGL